MQKEMTFGQLVLLEWRKRTQENERIHENKLNDALNELDAQLVKDASKHLNCEPGQLITKLLFEGIKESKLPYQHTAVLSMWGEEYGFFISPARAKEIVQEYHGQNGQPKQTAYFARKFAARLYLKYKTSKPQSQL